MPGPPLIVIGASAGGIEALRRLMPQLPRTLRAAVAVTIHRLPIAEDERLPRVLGRGTKLPVMHAADGDPLVPGRIYVAPAGVHLAVSDRHFRLDGGPKENGTRPSIDVLFRTAAAAKGPDVIGVLLSGLLHDGAAGLAAIKERGGRVVVQHPDDAAFGDMPRNALLAVDADEVVTIDNMGPLLVKLASDVPKRAVVPEPPEAIRVHSGFSCPDCAGVLNRYREGDVMLYRCRTGHSYTESGLFIKRARRRAAYIRRATEDVAEPLAIAAGNGSAEDAGTG